MNGGAQVECLQAAAGGVAVGEGGTDPVEDAAVVGDARPGHDRCALLQGGGDLLSARNLAGADVSLGVFEHQYVSREIGCVGTAEIQFHGVVSGDRVHATWQSWVFS